MTLAKANVILFAMDFGIDLEQRHLFVFGKVT